MAEAANKHGTSGASARRSRSRRTTTLCVLVPLILSTPGAVTAAHADAHRSAPGTPLPAAQGAARQAGTQPTAQQATVHPAAQSRPGAPHRPQNGTGSRSAEVTLNTVSPAVPDADGTLTLSGTATNRSRTALSDGEIVLYSGQRLASRSAIEQAGKRTGFQPGQEGTRVSGKGTTVEVDDLRPGQTRSFSLRVPVERLGIGDDGVHQLSVTLTGQSRAEPYEHVLGVSRTFLPQYGGSGSETDMTFVWPLISGSHLTARTESDRRQTPVFRDDRLAKEIAPGGRLEQLVALGKNLPVSWVVDPDLLASVDAMTKPYKVETPEGVVSGETRSNADARRWLNDLQEAVEDKEVVALPFGDPDLAALAHHGKKVSGTLGHLRPATDGARKTVETILHTTPNTDFAWPIEGAIDPSVVSVATSGGARSILTRSDSLRETDGLSYTPSAARPIGGGVTAVSADARLSRMFRDDMTSAEKATSAVQQFVAQSLALSEQNAAGTRNLVVAPQRMPSGSQARAMAAAVEALEDAGWSDFTELGEASKAKPDPKAAKSVPNTGAYPGRLRRQELDTNAFKQLQRTQSTLDDFTVILSQDDRVVTPFGNALRRELSTSWRGRENEAAAYRESVQAYLSELTRQVRLVQKSRMTLSGRSATIPVTVQNNLIQPVDGLELRLTSQRRIGLEIEEERQQVVVEGGHSQSLKFETSARANGRTLLEARLYTKDNKPYGPPMRFQVDVTEITSTVLLVIAGGVLLVVLAGVRMYTQRRRQGPAPDPDAPLVPGADADQRPEPAPEPAPEPTGTGTDSGSGTGTGAHAAGTSGTSDQPDPDTSSENPSDAPSATSDAGTPDTDTGPENPDSPGAGEKVDR
ncbi:DUF6049 family protein [Streptomyces tardus]|uniref:DUF6049 family protein n=1 Tax=Streptomyces tardus TaxID=2780544 RepID=UPI00355727FD